MTMLYSSRLKARSLSMRALTRHRLRHGNSWASMRWGRHSDGGVPSGRRRRARHHKDGLFPLSKALMSSRVNTKTALTDKIQSAVSEATTLYGTSFGWQTMIYPPENMLFLNVPVAVGSQQQYVMNTISGAWSNFTNMPAELLEMWNDISLLRRERRRLQGVEWHK